VQRASLPEQRHAVTTLGQLDATIVRLLLVPATMELLGDRNWWIPRWLDRILPKINVEGHADAAIEEEAEREPAGVS